MLSWRKLILILLSTVRFGCRGSVIASAITFGDPGGLLSLFGCWGGKCCLLGGFSCWCCDVLRYIGVIVRPIVSLVAGLDAEFASGLWICFADDWLVLLW